MDAESWKTAGTIAAVVISLCSLGFTYFSHRQNRYRISDQHVQSMLSWYSEAVEVLIRLRLCNRIYADMERAEDLAKLSALIERGRFFFPNIIRNDQYGAEKPTAFQGYRNVALDFLVASYNIFLSNHDISSHEHSLVVLQRNFTSVVFEVVVPQDRLAELRSMTGRYFVKQEIFEDFLKTNDGNLIKNIWITKTVE